jgi:hypothetical protein
MGGIDKDLHWPWLGFSLEQALERGLLEPKDVLQHATAEVMVSQLPSEVIVAIFARALASETLTPPAVLETAPPSLLAEHLEPDVLWRCLKDAADRAGLSAAGKPRTEAARKWLAAILQGAIETELLTPADVMRHLPPAEFVRDTPLPVMAELIKAGLLGGKFDPALVLQHLTPTVIADNLESQLAWGCIAEAATQKFELGGAGAAPRIESEKPQREDENTGKISVPVAAKKNGNGKDKSSSPGLREPRIDAVAPRRTSKTDPGLADLPKPDDWASAADDLDVVEESPLPPPPHMRKA